MYTPRFELHGFDVLAAPARCRIILELARALVVVNQIEWRKIRPKPLYESGIQYAFQGRQDDWKDLAQVIATGCGSCNSLAAWRAAELIEGGQDAGPYIRTDYQETSSGPLEVFHVIVWMDYHDGQGRKYEDPSALLGMPVPGVNA